MNALSAIYGGVARARRAWFTQRPQAARHLAHPVISIGNLVVGGSGKTPTVAVLATLLQSMGERPAVLSRGYARKAPQDGVLVVSDGTRILEPVDRSGDEPQMLARALPGVPVLVCADRFLAGTLAERTLGATVSILDDGFQHVQLARDLDLLLVQPSDLDEAVLPAGRLREPLSSASAADALIVTAPAEDAARVGAVLGCEHVFTLAAQFAAPRLVTPFGDAVPDGTWDASHRVVALAGVARPERFFATLESLGWHVTRPLTFRDHHWYTPKDLAEVEGAVRSTGAAAVVTTEKDAMRLAPLTLPSSVRWTYLPMRVSIEPAAAFRSWLATRLEVARASRPAVD